MPQGTRSTNILQYKVTLTSGDTDTIGIVSLSNNDCTAGCEYTVDANLFASIAPKTNYTLTVAAENVYGTSVESAQ